MSKSLKTFLCALISAFWTQGEMAFRVVRTACYLKLVFGKSSSAVDAFTDVYEKLAYG